MTAMLRTHCYPNKRMRSGNVGHRMYFSVFFFLLKLKMSTNKHFRHMWTPVQYLVNITAAKDLQPAFNHQVKPARSSLSEEPEPNHVTTHYSKEHTGWCNPEPAKIHRTHLQFLLGTYENLPSWLQISLLSTVIFLTLLL